MKKLRLSLRDLFALVCIVALLIALISSRREVARLNAELDHIVPLRELEIKAQLERQTAEAGMPVTMTSSTYSGNSYLISFEYFDPESGLRTNSGFTLRYDGNGHHVGAIRDDAFLSAKPDASGERGMKISVIDPLFADIATEADAE